MKHRLTVPLLAVLVLALAAFTGSALAGGGGANGSDGSNGNSANAPGQTKADQTPAAPAAGAPGQTKADQTPAAPAAQAAPAAPAAKNDKQSSTSAAAPATGGTNATGVKPSNTTDHDTYATASSDKTKLYGNGKTAGQIATQAGYGNAVLHGPGNSQPHKTAPCPGGHEVDVHALKHKSSAACAPPQAQTVTPATTVTATATAAATVATPAVVTPVATSVVAAQGVQATTAPAAAPATAAAQGTVKGFAVTMKAPKTLKPAKAKPAGGVLGVTKTLGSTTASSTLPFTGLPLWIFTLVAAGMIGVGLAMRRAAANRI